MPDPLDPPIDLPKALPVEAVNVDTAVITRSADNRLLLRVTGRPLSPVLRVELIALGTPPGAAWAQVAAVGLTVPLGSKKPFVESLDVTEIAGTAGVEVLGANGVTRAARPALGEGIAPLPVIHAGYRPVSRVDSVEAGTTADGALSVSAWGWASTSGWTDARLVPRLPLPNPGGEVVFDFVAFPPSGMVLQVLTPVSASWASNVLAGGLAQVKRIRVVAATNEASVALPAAPEGPAVAASGVTTQELVTLPMAVAVPAAGGALRLTLTAVNDSRCPDGVVCIWQGEVTAHIRVEYDGKHEEITLGTMGRPSADLAAGYRIELKDTFLYPDIGGYKVDTVTVLLLR